MSTAGPAINRERQTRPRLTDAGVTSRSYQTAPVVRGAFAHDPQIAPVVRLAPSIVVVIVDGVGNTADKLAPAEGMQPPRSTPETAETAPNDSLE